MLGWVQRVGDGANGAPAAVKEGGCARAPAVAAAASDAAAGTPAGAADHGVGGVISAGPRLLWCGNPIFRSAFVRLPALGSRTAQAARRRTPPHRCHHRRRLSPTPAPTSATTEVRQDVPGALSGTSPFPSLLVATAGAPGVHHLLCGGGSWVGADARGVCSGGGHPPRGCVCARRRGLAGGRPPPTLPLRRWRLGWW